MLFSVRCVEGWCHDKNDEWDLGVGEPKGDLGLLQTIHKCGACVSFLGQGGIFVLVTCYGKTILLLAGVLYLFIITWTDCMQLSTLIIINVSHYIFICLY